MDEDKDSKLFLRMLDVAAETIFDAFSQIMAVEASAIAVASDDEMPRKKRPRTSYQQPVLQEPCPDRKMNLSANDRTCRPQIYGDGEFVKGLGPTEGPDLAKNSNQPQCRPIFGLELDSSNAGRFGYSVNTRVMLPPIAENDAKTETKEVEKCDDFSKEIHDAINRIESLIPSLQKLVNTNIQVPIDQSVRNLDSQNIDSKIPASGPVNLPGVSKLRGNSGKEAPSRIQTRVPGSSSLGRPNRSSIMDKPDHKASQSQARERTVQFRHSACRNSVRRKFMSGASRSKITLQNQISDASTSSSPVYSSGGSSQQIGYPSSLSESYQSSDSYSNGSDEIEGENEKLHQSVMRKLSDLSESINDHETSSQYSSQDRYSDTGPLSQRNSDEPHQWEHDVEKGRRVGKLSKIRKKLGMIFHHHHHYHHYHYSKRDESDNVHASILKRLGKMFHRRGKRDRQRAKSEKSRKPVNNSVVKKKQQKGHFLALIDGGLMRHMRLSKKSKKAKDDTGRLASARYKGKTAPKKFRWWQKMGRGGVKMSNKGKVKFGTKARSQFSTAATRILR